MSRPKHTNASRRRGRRLGLLLASAVAATAIAAPTRAADPLLDETLNFTAAVTWLSTGVPALIMGAVRGGETSVAALGEIRDNTGTAPDGDTMFRIASISKVFCGAALASLVADGTVGLSDPLQEHLGFGIDLPEMGGRPLRLIDLATQASGLPREVPRPDAPADDPFATNTREAQIAALRAPDPLLFPPGTAAFYSNFGFDLLGAALANVSGQSYADLLWSRVLGPAGMSDTVFNLRDGDLARTMQGHNFDGTPLPDVPTPVGIECAGGLHTTANDLLNWIGWHLDRFGNADAEMRLIDHAAYLYRDGLDAVVGLDDGGPMDAMGLGWVVMLPQGDRPLILQKSGGLQGNFAYIAIAPTRGVGAFFVMNEFNTGGFAAAVEAINGLIGELAPR